MKNLDDLLSAPGAVVAVKRPLPVQVRFATAAGVCETLEGPVAYRSGDAILTGTVGESWPVEREKFDVSYVSADGRPAGTDGTYVKHPLPVPAVRLEAAAEVSLRGGTLKGEPGDWLVRYAEGDYGIVRGEIFAGTYEIRP